MAPLNWGLGHATRCIPIINALLKENFEPIIASDGGALKLLEKEFPNLTCFELPSYNIRYSKNANRFKYKLIKDAPHILKTIKKEKQAVHNIVTSEDIIGIISDNRFGVRHQRIPSVFISHQLRVLSGSTTWLSTKLHQRIISKFDECWVPDFKDTPNLSGALGHSNKVECTVRYIGPMSRFNWQPLEQSYDLLVLLSGPEPQRGMLSAQLLHQLKAFKGKVCFVKGQIEEVSQQDELDHITVYNFLTSTELEQVLNRSALVLCRSGYTTIMDLAKLRKKAFFIPTPGQFEQEYLAKELTGQGLAPSCKQQDFDIDKLYSAFNYKGFEKMNFPENYKDLFNLFKSKGKLTANA